MSDETRALAEFAADLTYERIPRHIRERAIDILVDQIGCQIGCSDLPWTHQVRQTFCKSGGNPEATVVRYGDRLPLPSAAFVNSTFGHSFEYNDVNPLSPGHPGPEITPALLAVAEREHVSGCDFLAAFVAAYEVRGHIGWALSPSMIERGGPQYSTACGPFGVAAGVGKLLGLGAKGIRDALGIAGGYSGGLMQYDHGGGSVKRVYAAIASSNGIKAALLAQAGMTGPEGILEGPRGILRIYSTIYQPERLVADLGAKWIIEHASFKPYSCCAPIHPAIDGLRKAMSDAQLKAEHVDKVEVAYPKRSYEHVAIASPYDLLGMQFSTSYSLALTALKGGNTPRDYTMQALADPEVKAFAAKVHIVEDAELTALSAGRFPARVKVTTRSGQSYQELVLNAKGSAGAPLTRSEIDSKFRSQVSDVLGADKSEKLLARLRKIETLDDVSTLRDVLIQ